MYEHAYHIDFGANATAYVDTFMRNIDWRRCWSNEDATKVAPPRPLSSRNSPTCLPSRVEECRRCWTSGTPVQLIDTRPSIISRGRRTSWTAPCGAIRSCREWIGELQEEPVVTFCVYGFHIGCQTAVALRKPASMHAT